MVIFDLDLTLVDSRSVLDLQRSRRWRAVFALVSKIEPYDGIPEVLGKLHAAHVPVAIVTSSPDQYCKKLVAHHGWPIDAVIGFHDTERRKPHPDPILLALNRMNVRAEDAVCVGDRADDTAAARAAGVFSIGAAWGSQEYAKLTESAPDLMCATVAELDAWLSGRFDIRNDEGRRGPPPGGRP